LQPAAVQLGFQARLHGVEEQRHEEPVEAPGLHVPGMARIERVPDLPALARVLDLAADADLAAGLPDPEGMQDQAAAVGGSGRHQRTSAGRGDRDEA